MGFTGEEKVHLMDMVKGTIPFDNNEPIVQHYNELLEHMITQEVIDTTTHESGHEAHQLADPGYSSRGHQREVLRQQGRIAEGEQMKYDLFDYDDYVSRSPTTEASLKEYIAYMTQNPFDSKKVMDNLFNHPDVGKGIDTEQKKHQPFQMKERNGI